MKTLIWKIDEENIDEELMARAGQMLKSGALAAFPTETVYGLGADALSEESARKTYAAKGRPSDNPLIVHIAEYAALRKVARHIPEQTKALAEHFWPGPLTMIFEKTDLVPYGTTGGLNTVAVRMPSDPIALALIRAAGGYVSAPSANTSGRPSPTTAAHVKMDLDGKIDLILDGGPCKIGLESTILDMTVSPPMILRPGAVTREMLEEVIGPVAADPATIDANSSTPPKAPGMKYRHYAPKARMIIVEAEKSTPDVQTDETAAARAAESRQGIRTGESAAAGAPKSRQNMQTGENAVAQESTAAGAPKSRQSAQTGESTAGTRDVKMPEDCAPLKEAAAIVNLTAAAEAAGQRAGIIATLETRNAYHQGVVKVIGTRDASETIAQNLYRILREFDDEGVDVIYSESFAVRGLGAAIMNRLKKAAGYEIIPAESVTGD